MNLTQNEATALLRAEAARCGSESRQSCPSAAHLIAMFTSIAEGVDRLGIADHLSRCGDCVREMDALVALFRGRRDVEMAPLSRQSRPRRGLVARLASALRGRKTRIDAAAVTVERAMRSFRGAIRSAVDKLHAVRPAIEVDAIAEQAIAEAVASVPPGASPEAAARTAVRAAFEVTASRLLDASRLAPRATPTPTDSGDAATLLAATVAGLPERRRQVVILHLVGLRIPEIAITLAFSDDQARNLLLRGLRDLGEALAGRGIILE